MEPEEPLLTIQPLKYSVSQTYPDQTLTPPLSSILILPTFLCPCLPKCLFLSAYPIRRLHFSLLATCAAHSIVLDTFTVIGRRMQIAKLLVIYYRLLHNPIVLLSTTSVSQTKLCSWMWLRDDTVHNAEVEQGYYVRRHRNNWVGGVERWRYI
jgi:hypothetical protein